jgi:hypothetical protein
LTDDATSQSRTDARPLLARLWAQVGQRLRSQVSGEYGNGLVPQTMTLIVSVFPAQRRGAAMGSGAWSPVLPPCPAPPWAASWSTVGWRWIFLVNVPIGLAALALTFLAVLADFGIAQPLADDTTAGGSIGSVIGAATVGALLQGRLAAELATGKTYADAFIATMYVTAIIPITVVLAGALACLLVRNHTRAKPADLVPAAATRETTPGR